jgi:hypothetical protein
MDIFTSGFVGGLLAVVGWNAAGMAWRGLRRIATAAEERRRDRIVRRAFVRVGPIRPGGEPATTRQVQFLVKRGVDADLAGRMSRSQAARLVFQIIERTR